jgi:dihydroxy-acid dehydratase
MGGNIGLLCEGDIIDIDIPGASINARVTDEECEARRADYEAPAPTVTSGWLVRYARYVQPAAQGAVMK